MSLDLATLKKQLQVRSALAVTLESGRIIVELVRRDNGDCHVAKSLTVAIEADSVVADPENAGHELARQLDAVGLHEKRCVVCVPPGWALTTSTDVPAMSAEDLRGYLELRAEREFPLSAAEMRLAHCAFALPDGGQRATLAAIPAKRLEAVERMIEVAGRRAVSISLGLDACVSREQPAALHFLSNGNHVDLVIAAGGGIAAVRTLPGPAGGATFDAAQFAREVRITLGRLPDTLRQQLREAHFSGAPISAANLCHEIRQPLSNLGIDSHLDRASEEVQGADHPGAAIGAADRYLRQQPVVFEFLPPQVHRWQLFLQRFDSRRRRGILAAALALIVLPIVAFFIRGRIESGLENEWKAMSGSVTELDTVQQRIRQFRAWFDPAPESVQILDSLAAAFPDQGEVWAKSIQITDNTKVSCTGFARNQAALEAFLDRLRKQPDVASLHREQVRGKDPVQFSINLTVGGHDAK
jgi:hypothetical protein